MTADGACDSAADLCIFKDRVTNSMWSEQQPGSTYTWSQAVNLCATLSWSGYADWRLPTAKELQAAYAHGFGDLAYRSGTSGVVRNNQNFASVNSYFISATTHSTTTTSAWGISMLYGFTNTQAKTSTVSSVICIRQ